MPEADSWSSAYRACSGTSGPSSPSAPWALGRLRFASGGCEGSCTDKQGWPGGKHATGTSAMGWSTAGKSAADPLRRIRSGLSALALCSTLIVSTAGGSSGGIGSPGGICGIPSPGGISASCRTLLPPGRPAITVTLATTPPAPPDRQQTIRGSGTYLAAYSSALI